MAHLENQKLSVSRCVSRERKRRSMCETTGDVTQLNEVQVSGGHMWKILVNLLNWTVI